MELGPRGDCEFREHPCQAALDGSIRVLHEFAVDGPGGVEFLDDAADLFCGLERLLVELGVELRASCWAAKFGDDVVEEEVVGASGALAPAKWVQERE